MSRTRVFISYSHQDETWKNRLVSHLTGLERDGWLELWDDRRIQAGDDRLDEIEYAIRTSAIAVLLISPDFLNSEAICDVEIPRLLDQQAAGDLRIVPLLIRPYAWELMDWLKPLQMWPRDGKPLSAGTQHQVDTNLKELAHEFQRFLPKTSIDTATSRQFVELDTEPVRRDDALEAIGRHTFRPGPHLANEPPLLRRNFVGREVQVRDVAGMLLEQEHHATRPKKSVAIQAMGGIGKSMLAAEVVRRLGPHYPGGVLYVDRGTEAESTHTVMQRWVKLVDRSYLEREVKPAEVCERLCRFGELLVLLDDIEEREFEETRILLDSLPPDANCLLTTRSTTIGSDLGSQLYELCRLSDEDALALLGDRLRLLKKAPDEKLLREVVSRLDGHPLSLELIAARCDRSADLPLLVAELDNILEVGKLGLEALEIEEKGKGKYRSVAASLALSFAGLEKIGDRVDDDLANRFIALGVFPGGGLIDEAMACALWGADPTETEAIYQAHRALKVFVRRAMLGLDREKELYLLHPLMRAFAHSRLRSDPERLHRVRARYIRHIIERFQEAYRQPPEEWKQYEHYERHLQYVGRGLAREIPEALGIELAALGEPRLAKTVKKKLTKEFKELLHLGSEFTHAVREFVVRRPEIGEQGRDWLKIGLACARVLGQKLPAIRYLRELGRWHLRRSPKQAEEYLAEAARLAHKRRRKKKFLRQEGVALSYRGEALRALSRPKDAIDCLDRALKIHRQLDNRSMIATSLKFLGETYWRKGALDQAQESYQEAKQIFEDMGLRAQCGDILSKIGSVYFNAGKPDEALRRTKEALEIHREVGNRTMEAEDLNDIGTDYRTQGRLGEAESALREAVDIAREIGYLRLESISLGNLASIYNERREYEESQKMAQKSLDLATNVGDRAPQATALNWIGLAHQHAGEHSEAEKCFRQALRLSLETEELRCEAAFRGNLGWLQAMHLGQREEGIANLKQTIRLFEDKGLEQAFGGRRIEDFRELLAKAEATGLRSEM